MQKVKAVLLVAVLILSLLLVSCSRYEKFHPPVEYMFMRHYILNIDVYEDDNGKMYLYKPGIGTFEVWDITENPPDFILQGENR